MEGVCFVERQVKLTLCLICLLFQTKQFIRFAMVCIIGSGGKVKQNFLAKYKIWNK